MSEQIIRPIRAAPPLPPLEPGHVFFTHHGYLIVSRQDAETHFPFDSLLAFKRGPELHLLPVTGTSSGGLIFKRRNAAGDRSVLIWEALDEAPESMSVQGYRKARWDAGLGALRIELDT